MTIKTGIIRSGKKVIEQCYRIMTIDEVKNLNSVSHAYLFTNYSEIVSIVKVKINGKVKRWKREEDRIEVPVKYGLYACTRVCYRYGVMEDNGLYFVVLLDS